jgi:NAD(P)H-hydrate epimerase
MKIFSAEQIRKADRYTIEHEPIASIDLMERASKAFVHWFVKKYEKSVKVASVCGTGNNGGDGLAVSRLLLEKGYQVVPWVLRFGKGGSGDFKTNLNRLSSLTATREVHAASDFSIDKHRPDVIIDAVFGSGLTRPVEGPYAEVLRMINESGAEVVAIDIPSGLFCDNHSGGDAIVQADQVVSFQLPKLAFLMPENRDYVGQWSVVDIGLSRAFLKKEETNYLLLRKPQVRRYLKSRKKFDHKGIYGSALIVSGSYGKMGAAVLSARACLRVGAGLTTVHAPSAGYDIIQTAVPEAMASTDVNQRFISNIPGIEKYDAIGIGPGIDTHMDTVSALERLLSSYDGPLVMDADALNILSAHKDLQRHLPKDTILTPHPGEFKRLAGSWTHDFEKLQKLQDMARELEVCIVLKGYHTAVALADGRVYFNTTGNPGMATGGSGDVLTGILTGLLAQGYVAGEAALLGVYLHGLAGDLACAQKGEEALIASDITEHLAAAYAAMKS